MIILYKFAFSSPSLGWFEKHFPVFNCGKLKYLEEFGISQACKLNSFLKRVEKGILSNIRNFEFVLSITISGIVRVIIRLSCDPTLACSSGLSKMAKLARKKTTIANLARKKKLFRVRHLGKTMGTRWL